MVIGIIILNIRQDKMVGAVSLKKQSNVLEKTQGILNPKKLPEKAPDSQGALPPMFRLFFRPPKHIETLAFLQVDSFRIFGSHRRSHFSRTGFEKAFFGSAKIETAFVIYNWVGEGILLNDVSEKSRAWLSKKYLMLQRFRMFDSLIELTE